jgi:hypothetical protein
MSNNRDDWDRYEIHVLETLKRLEEKHDKLYDFVTEHMREEEKSMAELNLRLQKVETNAKWYVRIFTVVWGFIVTGVNVWIGKNI